MFPFAGHTSLRVYIAMAMLTAPTVTNLIQQLANNCNLELQISILFLPDHPMQYGGVFVTFGFTSYIYNSEPKCKTVRPSAS
jgi:hypothetical protein